MDGLVHWFGWLVLLTTITLVLDNVVRHRTVPAVRSGPHQSNGSTIALGQFDVRRGVGWLC